MTEQETFDIVAKHLLTQNKKAMAVYGFAIAMDMPRCAYRGNDGTKCAAGCLIPDDDYNPDMEGRGITTPNALHTVLTAAGHDIQLVEALQYVHDVYPVSAWREQLADVAARFGLNTEVLQ